MDCYSAIKRNKFESVLMRWMNLEPIKQSEESQKDKYCICMESRKMALMNLFAVQKWRTRHREQTYGHERGEERVRWLDSITNSLDMNSSKLQEVKKDSRAWCAAVHGVTKNQT